MGIGISRCYSMGEVQLRRIVRRGSTVALVHLVNGDTQRGMIVRRASVVEVAGVRRHGGAGQREKSQELEHVQDGTLESLHHGPSIFLCSDCSLSVAGVSSSSFPSTLSTACPPLATHVLVRPMMAVPLTMFCFHLPIASWRGYSQAQRTFQSHSPARHKHLCSYLKSIDAAMLASPRPT